MRRRASAVMMMAGLLAALHGSTPQAVVAGGVPPSTLVSCQRAHPSGAPIRITITELTNLDIIGLTVSVGRISVVAEFGGATFGAFTAENVTVTDVLNSIDAGCKIFNESGLSSQILAATGLPGTELSFTICSFLGASHPDCNLPAGTINAPPGFVSEQITGYARP